MPTAKALNSLANDLDPDIWVMADGQRLKQVLLNLVGNALKFTEKGKVCLSISQSRRDERHLDVRFAVSTPLSA